MKILKRILAKTLIVVSAAGCTGAVDSNAGSTDEQARSALATYAELKYGDEKTVSFSGADYWVGYKFTATKDDIVDLVITPMTSGADAYVYLYSGDFGVTRRDAPDTSIQFTEVLKRTGWHYLLVHNDKNLATQFKVSIRKVGTKAASDAGSSDAGSADAVADAGTPFEHGAITDLFAFNSTEPTTPATKQDLAALFAPGTITTTVGGPLFVQRTRACNLVTGCTKWEPTVRPEVGYYTGGIPVFDQAFVQSQPPANSGRTLKPAQLEIVDGMFRFAAELPAWTNSNGSGAGTVIAQFGYAPDSPPPVAPSQWINGYNSIRAAWRTSSLLVYDGAGNQYGAAGAVAFTTYVTKTYVYGRTQLYKSLAQPDGIYLDTEYASYARISPTQVLTPTAAGETLSVTW